MANFDATTYFLGIASALVVSFIGAWGVEWLKMRSLRKSIANAMLAEIMAAKDSHMKVIGDCIDQTADNNLPDKRVTFAHPADPFPIFRKLSEHLGIFPKEDARCLARAYTEATAFVGSTAQFFDRMNHMDKLVIEIHRADAVADTTTSMQIRKEWEIQRDMQLSFFPTIKSLQRHATGQLFNDVKIVFQKYG